MKKRRFIHTWKQQIPVPQHSREFLAIVVGCGVCFLLGWVWHGLWLMSALGLLQLIGLWGRYTEERLISPKDHRRIEIYKKLWGTNWRQALGRDYPELLQRHAPREQG